MYELIDTLHGSEIDFPKEPQKTGIFWLKTEEGGPMFENKKQTGKTICSCLLRTSSQVVDMKFCFPQTDSSNKFPSGNRI